MTETHMRPHRNPICDNAETLAGAGTDVRRYSDALGPRKNLQVCGVSLAAESQCVVDEKCYTIADSPQDSNVVET